MTERGDLREKARAFAKTENMLINEYLALQLIKNKFGDIFGFMAAFAALAVREERLECAKALLCENCGLPESKHEEWHDRSCCPGTHNLFRPAGTPPQVEPLSVMDHKYVAGECHDHGCHFLFLEHGGNCTHCAPPADTEPPKEQP